MRWGRANTDAVVRQRERQQRRRNRQRAAAQGQSQSVQEQTEQQTVPTEDRSQWTWDEAVEVSEQRVASGEWTPWQAAAWVTGQTG